MKNISRRQFLRLSAGAAAAAGVASQFGRMPAGFGALTRAYAATTITLWHGWTGADNTDALNKVLEKFNTENKDGLTIEPTPLEWDQFFSKWVVSAAAGNPPDVALYHSSELPEFAERGITTPITDLISKVGIDTKGVPDAVLKATSWKGQVMAVPGDLHPMAMYYNTDMVKEAGLDATKPPKTGDELLNWATKMTTADHFGIDVPSTGAIPRWMWFSLLHQFGGTFLDEQGKAAVNSEASQKALQFLVDLIFKHKVASQGGGNLTGVDNFAAKKAAIRFVGPWEVNLRMSAKMNFNTTPFPVVGSKPAAWANTHILSLSKQKSPDKYEAGVKFMKWFFDNYALPAKTVGIIPVSPTALASKDFTDDERYQYYKAFVDTLPNAVLEPSIPQYTAIFSFGKPTPLTTNLEAALSNAKPVKQALDDMKAGIDEELAKPIS
ncbi:MAG: ABC transporter substrate-binding protein [Anaerolineae bacterium]|nr:ABC transporter substrate-binding protein [Anaerolineae bacterium]